MIEPDELASRVREIYRSVVAVGVHNTNLQVETSGCVDGAAGTALTGALYADDEPDEPDPLQVAAFLLRSLARNHCFGDGNKRVAWASVIDYLQHNGYTIGAPQDLAAEFVESVAKGDLADPREIAIWLANQLIDITLDD